jgi:hypothetical protein
MSELANNPILTEGFGKVLGHIDEAIPQTETTTEVTPPVTTEPVVPEITPTTTPVTTETPTPTEPVTEAKPIVDVDSVIREQFASYQIGSVAEIKQTLEDVKEVVKLNDQLAQEVNKLKAEPYFANPNDKRVFDYIKTYRDATEGFEHYLLLEKTDLSNLDSKEAMKLAYIIENKDMPQKDAERMFEHTYKKTYRSFDEDDEAEKEIAELSERNAARQAKMKLAEIKEKFGQKPKEAFETPEQRAADVVIRTGIEQHLKNWDESIPKITQYTVKTEGSGEQKLDLTDEDRNILNVVLRPLLENRANYQPNGTLSANMQALVENQIHSLIFQRALDKVGLEAYNRGLQEAQKSIVTRQADKAPVTSVGGGQPSQQQLLGEAILKSFKR